jgi:sigma-B regulation protein RsbU (phosphoserine phosphatase)
MKDSMQENIKEIEKIFSSFIDFYNLKSFHIYTYDQNELKETYRLGKDELGQHPPLKIDEIVIKKAELRKIVFSNTRSKYLKKITTHFGLHVFSIINASEKSKFYLGLIFESNKITDRKKREHTTIHDTIEKLLQNFMMVKEIEVYNERITDVLTEVSALHDISRAIEFSNDLDSLLGFILKKAKDLMKVESASMMLVVEGTNELEFKVVLGPKSKTVRPFRLPIGKGISGWVAEHGEAILIEDVYADPRFDPTFDKRSGYRTRSMLCVPLKWDNRVVGVMTVLNPLDKKPFVSDDKKQLLTFAIQAALSIENAKLVASALEKERLDQELRMASEIQTLLLPRKIPDLDFLDIDATYIPCKEMSGDFYDIIILDENRTVFVVADVSGKGVPGAMVVSNMQASLKAFLKYSSNLIEVVSQLNEAIILNTTSDRYITFFIGIYDKRDDSFQYINAGHNPPLLIRDNDELVELNIGGIFVGSLPWEYEMDTIFLGKNDLLTLFTDGLVEAMNEKEEEFEKERLSALLKKNKKQSSKEILKTIIHEVKEFAGAADFEDDFTVMVIKRV